MLDWLIKNLFCRWYGHRRGKRVGAATDIVTGKLNFYCPRCKTRWTRKERKPAKLKAVA